MNSATQSNKLFSDSLRKLIASLPKAKQEQLFEKARSALTLGLRSIVLNGLAPVDKNEFEKIILEKGDEDLFLFAQSHVENFDSRFADVMDEVSEALALELKQ